MPHFTVTYGSRSGRLGKFNFSGQITSIDTPFMFPVSSLITGTTPRGGGIIRYILQANNSMGLLRTQKPLLVQVLHFLDYGVSPASVANWRSTSIRGRYNSDETLGLDYQAPLFLDSGGFQLMWRNGMDLSNYGIDLSPSQEALSITKLQLDFGANIIASLDYPIPPKLAPEEAKKRMKRSRKNAITTADYVRNLDEIEKPFLYMPVHGRNAEEIRSYFKNLLQTLKTHDLEEEPIGFAIGSLVPLRLSHKNMPLIIQIVQTAIQSIPIDQRRKYPIHVFGIAGLLIPFLAYLGVDTFDSSTYTKEAVSLGYLDPETRSSKMVYEMQQSDVTCQCSVCQDLNVREMQQALATETKSRPLPNGHYKSKYYADLALHNLTLDLEVARETREAIAANCLDEYLLGIASRFGRMTNALEAVANLDPQLAVKASRTGYLFSSAKTEECQVGKVSIQVFQTLTHTPTDFDINANGYRPKQARILLLLPCTADKPYSESSTHKYVQRKLDESLPDWQTYVHKVSLSGLYGPVPQECELEPAVLDYNFRLQPQNRAQISLCTARLEEFLDRHQDRYDYYVAYATSKAYRQVFDDTAKRFSNLIVLPKDLSAKKLTQFFKSTNINQLIEFVSTLISSG